MFFDPIRDIYEVNHTPCWDLKTLMSSLGFHDLHILPTLNKLHRGGKSFDNHDARSRACPSPVAPESLPPKSRYLGPTHLFSNKTWNTSVCLAEANTGTCLDNHEGYRDV